MAKKQTAFEIDVLRNQCRKLFGVSQSMFDGAMAGVEGPVTLADVKAKIEKWKNEEAK